MVKQDKNIAIGMCNEMLHKELRISTHQIRLSANAKKFVKSSCKLTTLSRRFQIMGRPRVADKCSQFVVKIA